VAGAVNGDAFNPVNQGGVPWIPMAERGWMDRYGIENWHLTLSGVVVAVALTIFLHRRAMLKPLISKIDARSVLAFIIIVSQGWIAWHLHGLSKDVADAKRDASYTYDVVQRLQRSVDRAQQASEEAAEDAARGRLAAEDAQVKAQNAADASDRAKDCLRYGTIC
jgi:hypothetical protein